MQNNIKIPNILGFIVYYLLLKPVSLLPLRILYVLARIAYFFVYVIFGYRKAVVWENISNSFPEKSMQERQRIMQQFYHFLTELMVETVWTFSITPKRVDKHFKVVNPEVLDGFYDEGKDVVLVLAHYSFFELVLSALNRYVKHQVETIYVPLTNRSFDKYFYQMRTTFGSKMIAKRNFKASFDQKKGLRTIIFGADQSPSISKNLHWTNFLNQDTAVALGVERYARKYNMPVVYGHLYPAAKGRYNLEFIVLTKEPLNTKDGEITEMHVRQLEQQIRSVPEYWLWSHKRWKKKRDQ